jgi:hypothetical protein
MSANDPKRTSRAGTLTPHVVRGRCRTRRCASSSALGSAPCRNQATSQRQKVRGRRIANTEEAPVGVPPGLLPMSMRLRPGPAVTQATETLLPRSFEGKRRGRDTTSAYDLGERHQTEKCSSSRSVQRLRLLAGFFASLDLSLTYLSGGNQRFDALLREAFAMFIHAISKQVTPESILPTILPIVVCAILPFCIGDGTREGCGGKRPSQKCDCQK